MRIRLLVGAVACLLATCGMAQERNRIAIKEWPVPWGDGRPRDPSVAPDKAIWFVGQKNHYIARFDSSAGTFTRRELGDRAGPHNLIVGADGIVWYAGNAKGYIGRYDPTTDRIEKIAMPEARAGDPHTLIFDGNEEHIWFTVQWGNFVGRLRLSDRAVDLIPVPTADARPYGIIVAPNGVPWIALLGTNKLASVDPATLKLKEHTLPHQDAAPRRLAATRDGRIYYVDYSRGSLGRLEPKNGSVREWLSPSGAGSGPYAMAVDDRDNIWFVETGGTPNHLVGFSTETESFFSITRIPSGAGSVRHMVYDAKSRTIWFGTDRGTIARAAVAAR